MSRYQFCNRPAYFRQLATAIAQAGTGDRVGLATMVLDQRDPLVLDIIVELTAAAHRGAEIYFVVDALSFMLSGEPRQFGPLWYSRSLAAAPGLYGERFKLLENLRLAGGHYAVINQPRHRFSLPVAGRSHIKTAVINNRVYIGGHNLDSADRIDLMTFWDNHKTADIIFGFLQQVVAAGAVRKVYKSDQRFKLSQTDDLLIDAGQRHTSLILDEALTLIDDSKDWLYMTCQYFPGGLTGRHLQAAMRRGVKVTLIFSPPKIHGAERLGHQLYEWAERLRLSPDLFTHKLPNDAPKLHAKLIATEQGAIIGSHNYVDQGVWLGTAEIALLRRDPAFAKAAVQAIQTELKDYI